MRDEEFKTALTLVYILLGHDPKSEMFEEYRISLEGIVKEMDESDDDCSSSGEEDDSNNEESSSSSSSGEEEDNDIHISEDKKEQNQIEEDEIDYNMGETPMTNEQKMKLEELKSQFSQLRAAVSDGIEGEERLWTERERGEGEEEK